MLSREELARQLAQKLFMGNSISLLWKRFYLVSSACQPFLDGPFPIFSGYIPRKAKNITDCNFNYLQHSQLHEKHMYPAHLPPSCRQKEEKKNPRYVTRFPAFELQWCICNTASWLQAALQGHKQMAWYYSPDLGLPSVNRAVNHSRKKKIKKNQRLEV